MMKFYVHLEPKEGDPGTPPVLGNRRITIAA
jgi:hypothetical protein